MKMLEPPLSRLYEALANHFANLGDAGTRDQCLVLAADAALIGGQPAEAERLRKRLLLTTPHHRLRPYASMAEAMASADIRAFVLDLRRQWPPEKAMTLIDQAVPLEAAPSYALEPPPATPPVARPQSRRAMPEAVSPGGYWMAWLMVTLGVALAGGVAFIALGWSLVE